MTDTIGIDLGTSAIKVARFDRSGEMVACVARGYRDPNEHEVPFERIWEALTQAFREVVEATSDRPAVAGIGLASQTNSFALVTGPEQPVTPADVWTLSDRGQRPLLRQPVTPVYLWTGYWAGREADELNERLTTSAIARATGMCRLTGQSLAPKCLHLRRTRPELWAAMRCVWQLPDLVCHGLCGVAASDASIWSLTGLHDLDRQGWWPAMLAELDISADRLPIVSPPDRYAGRMTVQAARELRVPAGIPVVAGVLDHLAAAAGVENIVPGMASVSTGTASCVVVTHRDRPPAMTDGVIGRHPVDPSRWYALTWSGLSSTGLNWCARQAGGEHKLSELLDAARAVPAGAGGWQGVPRDPHNGDAGFTFTRAGPVAANRSTDAQAMRAILECLTAEIARLLDLAASSQHIERLVVMGGGARSDLWLQLLADRLGVPVIRPACIEAAAAGAARFAAHAAGLIESPAVAGLTRAETFEPMR